MNLLILYYIPQQNLVKYNEWHDGFTKAINILKNKYDITMDFLFQQIDKIPINYSSICEHSGNCVLLCKDDLIYHISR